MRTKLYAVLLAVLILLHAAAWCAFAYPDAQLLRITAEGNELHDGDRVPMRIEIRNLGNDALPPSPVTLTIDDGPYAEWKLPDPLPPNNTAVWPLTWTATRGSHLIVATVDPLNDILESNEANNSAFINLGVAEAQRPFPWPAFAAGLVSFLVAAGAAFLLRRILPSRRA